MGKYDHDTDGLPHIKVIHYGPKTAAKADHSTSIAITRGKFTRHFVLENDAELNDLIRKLQAARWAGDGAYGAQKSSTES